MELSIWLAFVLTAIGILVIPGPTISLVMSYALSQGRSAAAAIVAGVALGDLTAMSLSLLGLGALLAASATLFTVLKWIGAAYLVYLGIRIWRAPAPVVALASAQAGASEARPLRLFNQGFLVAVSHPKALIFFAAFLPQFMEPGVSYRLQLAVFGGTFVVVEIAYELLLALMADRVAPWLARHGRWFNRAAGATFVGIGAALTTASR